MLDCLDMDQKPADISKRPTSQVSLRLVQSRFELAELEQDAPVDIIAMVSGAMGQAVCFPRRSEHQDPIRQFRWRLPHCDFGRRLSLGHWRRYHRDR